LACPEEDLITGSPVITRSLLLRNAGTHGAVFEGAVQRVRAKVIAAMAIVMGLLPIMWSHGAGVDIMKGSPPR
jgi:Cu(I)/Ag(I) efflux system membrane protein CusA/SilA